MITEKGSSPQQGNSASVQSRGFSPVIGPVIDHQWQMSNDSAAAKDNTALAKSARMLAKRAATNKRAAAAKSAAADKNKATTQNQTAKVDRGAASKRPKSVTLISGAGDTMLNREVSNQMQREGKKQKERFTPTRSKQASRKNSRGATAEESADEDSASVITIEI